MVPPWTTPADIRAETERFWARGVVLTALLDEQWGADPGDAREGQPEQLTFPVKLRLRRPKGADLGSSFEAVRKWIATLEAASRSATGAGFEIAWEEINTRHLGRNRVPVALTLPALDDALAVIGRADDARRFLGLATATRLRFPALGAWLRRRPLAVLDFYASWVQLLDCVAWFQANPRSGLYARQIDVAGIDSKFIEAHKAILSEMLDQVLAPDAITASASGVAAFEARHGLSAKPALVRFRTLDPRLAIRGLTDLTVRLPELATLDVGPERVFIVENEITGLAFPNVVGALLMFGGGYAVDQLAAVSWLRACPVDYWGDIDTHGFAILDRLRAIFPQARSMLMDRETLLAHRAAWSFETSPHVADLSHLTNEEATLYDDLRRDRYGPGVRLEQERIPMRAAMSGL